MSEGGKEGKEVSIKDWVVFKKTEGIQKSRHAPESDHEVSQINPELSSLTDPMFLSKVNVENAEQLLQAVYKALWNGILSSL